MLREAQSAGEIEVPRWVEELRRGEHVEANSRRVFERYYGWVRSFFSRRGIPRERAEELAQETFLQCFRRIRSFRGQGSFESWLFAIAANHFRNDKRRRSQQKRDRPEVSLDGEAAPGANGLEVVGGTESPAAKAFNKERLKALGKAIDELPEKPGHCIRLRLAGYEYPEIAELLKLSPSTARVHVYTARQRLQDRFGDEFGGWMD